MTPWCKLDDDAGEQASRSGVVGWTCVADFLCPSLCFDERDREAETLLSESGLLPFDWVRASEEDMVCAGGGPAPDSVAGGSTWSGNGAVAVRDGSRRNAAFGVSWAIFFGSFSSAGGRKAAMGSGRGFSHVVHAAAPGRVAAVEIGQQERFFLLQSDFFPVGSGLHRARIEAARTRVFVYLAIRLVGGRSLRVRVEDPGAAS
ncbi:hypothetical protein BC828DRAFT_90806 [Blastocladiella britannica]|nr:hypothetical protein BC828DRAFT_90806 [Blastocladiella britannica]